MGTIDREDLGLCRYTGCTDMAANSTRRRLTTTVVASSPAGLVASAFGYLDSCSAFVDTDADLRQDEDEPRGRTDRGGYLSLTRRTSHYVQLLPGSVDSPSCTDGLLGVRLQVLLLTHASAEVMTPLTTLASVLSMPGRGLTRSEASDTVWRGLELPERSVWEFDALAQIFAAPAQRESALWLVRQQQVLGAVTCAYRLIADVIPDFDPLLSCRLRRPSRHDPHGVCVAHGPRKPCSWRTRPPPRSTSSSPTCRPRLRYQRRVRER